MAGQAAIQKPPAPSGAKSNGGCGGRAPAIPGMKNGKPGFSSCVAGGRLELAGHLRAVELTVDDGAVQLLTIGATADDVKTIDLVSADRFRQ